MYQAHAYRLHTDQVCYCYYFHLEPESNLYVLGLNHSIRGKKSPKTIEWHAVHDVFTSPASLKKKLQETFGDKLPTADELLIGYTAKRGKHWIVEEADLTSMYKHFEHSGKITMFCEGHSKSLNAKTRKRKAPNYTYHE